MESQRLARRTVVRASAWSVPVIAVAATAPAYAASPLGAKLQFDNALIGGADWSGSKPTRLESQVQVQNVWVAEVPTVTSLELTVSYPQNAVSGGAATAVTGSGWSWKKAELSGSRWVHRFVWVGRMAPGGSTSNLTYRVPIIAPYPPGLTVTPSFTAAASGGIVMVSASYTLP